MNSERTHLISYTPILLKAFLRHPFRSLAMINSANIRRFITAAKTEPAGKVKHNLFAVLDGYVTLPTPVTSNEKVKELEEKYPGITNPVGIGNAYALEEKFRKIPVEVDAEADKTVNVLLPQLDPSIMFGGYISCFQFIKALVSQGLKVRILICESHDFCKDGVFKKLANNPDLLGALQQCSYENVSLKSDSVIISPQDSFVAYSFWTGVLAHDMAQAVNKKFIFFIQEYEPIFHPQDSFYAVGEYVYNLPHYAIFNTVILRDFFKINGYGVFKDGAEKGLENSCFYQHALTKTSPPELEELKKRTKKRFLFYGRPENHAKRNLFEIGLVGLKIAAFSGVFDDEEWEFIGVGTLGTEHEIELGHGHKLILKSKMEQGDYAKALQEFDVGLSLMFAPHPSILPFEMSSSGIVTVTNTYEGRDEKLLKSISGNLVPCEPNVYAVADAIRTAIEQSEDKEARLKNAKIDWVNDWNDSFNSDVMKNIVSFIDN